MDRYIQSVTISVVIFGVLALDNEINNGTKQAESDANEAVRGQWGPWTEWSLCGKSCGYGTQYRIRRCHTLKQENVSCAGDSKQYKICNDGECPPGHRDYRSIECAKHNHIYYGSRRYRWTSYINDQSPCELSCKSVGYGYYARFKTTVEDGVICNEHNTASCLGGTCLKSGCDSILGSGSKEDICGVCGGSGHTCRIITGIYTRTHLAYREYNIVAVIPAGARAINITEIGRSKNHLALWTPRGYFLNGHLRLQNEGEVKGAGTVFTYKRGRRRNGCRGECLTADGPLNTYLRVELIYFGRNPGIMYSYAIPNNDDGQVQDDDDDADSGDHDTDPLTHAGKIYIKVTPNYVGDPKTNPGKQQLQQQPKNERRQQQQRQRQQDANVRTRDPNKIIHQKENKPITRQKRRHGDQRTKNTTRINPQEKYGDRITVKMVPGGQKIKSKNIAIKTKSHYGNKTDREVQYRHYYHTSALDGLGDVPVKTEAGRRVLSSYNTARRTAHKKVDASDNKRPHSSASSQSLASSSSSSAQSYIDNNVPLSRHDNEYKHNNDDDPSGKDKRTSLNKNARNTGLRYNRRRLSAQNDVYSWRISGFTDCTESCGGGLQETRVVCIKSDSQVEVMEEDCDITSKPETTTVVCNNQPCEPSWTLSQWSPCSVSCGRGLRKREVNCQQRISPTLTIPVSLNNCPSPRPQSRQYCQLDPCYKWKPSNWSQCSTVCGFGQRSRTLTCVDTREKEVKSHICTTVKPATEEICDMGSCAQGWFHSKWTKECSVDCGRGHYIRKVYCSAPDGSPLDEDKCGGRSGKPRETKSCKADLPCGGQWFVGPWTKCNGTCGADTVRRREVLCIKKHGKRVRGITKEQNCDESKKPPYSEKCPSMPDCKPQWYMMAWSNCSKTCNTGVRTREVTCLDVNLKQSPDCDKNKKPSTRQSCNTFPCEQRFEELSSNGGMTQILQQDGTIIDVPSCDDKNGAKWCRLVSQARLCGYYKEKCCQTCSRHNKSNG